MAITWQQLKRKVKQAKTPGNDTIIVESAEFQDIFSCRALPPAKIIHLIDKDFADLDEAGTFFSVFLRAMIPLRPAGAARKARKLAKALDSLVEKYDPVNIPSESILDLAKALAELLNGMAAGKVLVFEITEIDILDRLSLRLLRQLLEKKCKFSLVAFFSCRVVFGTGREAKERARDICYRLYYLLVLCNRIRMWNKSLFLVDKLLRLQKRISDKKLLGLIHFRAGMVYARKGSRQQAIASYRVSGKYLAAVEDKQNLTKALNNLGNLYVENGKFRQGLQLFKRTLAIAEERQDEYSLAVTYSSMGRAHNYIGEPAVALDYLKKSLLFMARSGYFSRIQLNTCFVADAHLAMGDRETALYWYRQADEVSKVENISLDRILIKQRLGEFYLGQGEFSQCAKEFAQAEALGKKICSTYSLLELYFHYGEMFKAWDKARRARQYYRKALDLAVELKEKRWVKTIDRHLGELVG